MILTRSCDVGTPGHRGEAAKRQSRVQEVEASLDPIPFDGSAARSYGLVVAAGVRQGHRPPSRVADLLIAATAHANGLDSYTRNGQDLVRLDKLLNVSTPRSARVLHCSVSAEVLVPVS